MEKSTSERHTKLHWALNWKVTFSLALTAGLSGLSAALLMLYTAWSSITFASSSFYTEAERILASTYGNGSVNYTNGLQYVTGVINLTNGIKDGALLFVPLAAIAGALLVVTAFYFRSKRRKTVLYGCIFSAVFSMVGMASILAVVLLSPNTVANLFDYAVISSSTGGYAVPAFGLLLASMVLGLFALIFGVYRLSLMPERQ